MIMNRRFLQSRTTWQAKVILFVVASSFLLLRSMSRIFGNLTMASKASRETIYSSTEVMRKENIGAIENTSDFDMTDTPTQSVNTSKTILFFNSFWHWNDFQIGFGEEAFSRCSIKSCRAVSRPEHSPSDKEMSTFDAVVIHAGEFELSTDELTQIQSWRKPNQRFVFFNMEPPPNSAQFHSANHNNFWNYTMTFRQDSDVLIPYGHFVLSTATDPQTRTFRSTRKTSWPVLFNQTKFQTDVLPRKGIDFYTLAKRPKKVAWVVSNCFSNSQREAYVAELRKYVDVTTYGKCGIPCNVEGSSAHLGSCAEDVRRDYKFYLAFENAFVKDYVTEKFFQRAKDGLLPIVLGQADYSQIAPPHSYIDVFDFDSPKKLASFLHMLDKNDTEYLSYFWWRDHYQVISDALLERSFCDLCAKLHEDVHPKTYADFGKWWHTESQLNEKLPQLLSLISNAS